MGSMFNKVFWVDCWIISQSIFLSLPPAWNNSSLQYWSSQIFQHYVWSRCWSRCDMKMIFLKMFCSRRRIVFNAPIILDILMKYGSRESPLHATDSKIFHLVHFARMLSLSSIFSVINAFYHHQYGHDSSFCWNLWLFNYSIYKVEIHLMQ